MTDRTIIPPDAILTALQDGYTVTMAGSSIIGWKARAGLTPRMRAAFEFIKSVCDQGYTSPSYEEIKIGLGLRSKSEVARLVTSLIERGYVTRDPYKARSLQVVG